MGWKRGNEPGVSQAEQLALVPDLEKHQHFEQPLASLVGGISSPAHILR